MIEQEDLDYFDSNSETAPKIGSSPNKKNIVCFKCNYKFSLKASNFFSIICPWCGANQDSKRK